MSADEFNYLFVSDFHVAMGVDPQHGITHPREDFFYDEEFYRFLRWADQHPEGRKKTGQGEPAVVTFAQNRAQR